MNAIVMFQSYFIFNKLFAKEHNASKVTNSFENKDYRSQILSKKSLKIDDVCVDM